MQAILAKPLKSCHLFPFCCFLAPRVVVKIKAMSARLHFSWKSPNTICDFPSKCFTAFPCWLVIHGHSCLSICPPPVPALSPGHPAAPGPPGRQQQVLRHSAGRHRGGAAGGSRHRSQRLRGWANTRTHTGAHTHSHRYTHMCTHVHTRSHT